MSASVCPYLGLKEDPKTTLSFPSDGNCCFHASPVAPVNREHQLGCCLTPGHVNCPVFQRTKLSPLPAELQSPAYRHTRQSRGILTVVVLALALLGSIGLRSVLRGSAAQGTTTPVVTESQLAVLSPTSSAQAGVLQPFAATFMPSPTPFNPPGTAAPATTVTQSCTPAQGWMEYAVKPTDSTFRLSVVFRVTVEDLLQGNCLDPGIVLRPGQTILVPPPPTTTPTSTATITPTPTIQPTEPPAWVPPPPREDYPAAPTDTSRPQELPPTSTPELPTDQPPQQPTDPPAELPTNPPTDPPPTEKPLDTPTPPPLP